MPSGWQNRLARISRMAWEEVWTRAEQQFHKHSDLLIHKMGLLNAPVRLNSNLTSPPGRFFFSEHELSERAELLCKHLPNQAAEIVHQADEICGHRFRILGFENLDYTRDEDTNRGCSDIDWHLDPVNRKSAPLQPWFKIPFLDFAAVGDHKIIWELNRHQHLVILAKAHLLSGDNKYAQELITQWRSWVKANSYPLGINWASTLEVAFRSLSWIWIDHLLPNTDAYAEFRAELIPALAFHGRYIERYLSTYFSPNTHLLGEALTLLFLGTLYPQMQNSARWKKSGWKIVQREAGRQVRPDGVYFEQSLHYHVYALDFFLHARLLAARNGMEISSTYDAVVARMLDVLAAIAQAGAPEGFGDDDGGRLFDPRRNRTEQMTDPLALGAVTYGKNFSAANLTEEAIWLFGNQAIRFLALEKITQSAHSVAFPSGGLYVLADSQPYTQVMVVDAGPQGEGRSGHGHADSLSLRLAMNGERWLVDAGSSVYISKDPADRNTFRGTGAHNTVRVDGLDQAIADEPFSWTHIPTTIAEKWIIGNSFTYFVGSHDGYERLADPVTHRRHVLKIAGGAWLVRDMVVGHAEHEVEIRWHFAPDLEVRNSIGNNASGRIEISKVDATPGEPKLTLIVPEGTVWQANTEVTRTILSPAYGSRQPASIVRCDARIQLPAETATALVPGISETRQSDEHRLTSMTQSGVQVYELDYHDESQGFFFALSGDAWSFGPWSSDARALYCRIEDEKLAHLVVIGGTHVAWQGQPLISKNTESTKPPEFFEWGRSTLETTDSGGFSVTPLFQDLTGEQLTGASRVSSLNTDNSASGQQSSSFVEKH